jgi:hypothetical protein
MKRLVLALAVVTLVCPTPSFAQQIVRTGDGIPCSGTIAAGGVSQIATPGDAARAWLVIENPITATEPLLVGFGPSEPATTGVTEIGAGGSMSFLAGVVPSGQVKVSAATTGHRYICRTGR